MILVCLKVVLLMTQAVIAITSTLVCFHECLKTNYSKILILYFRQNIRITKSFRDLIFIFTEFNFNTNPVIFFICWDIFLPNVTSIPSAFLHGRMHESNEMKEKKCSTL